MTILASSSMRFACAWLLMLGYANAALLRTAPRAHRLAAAEASSSIASDKVAHLLDARSLAGSVTQIRRTTSAVMAGRAVPDWARPMPKCAKAVNATLAKLSAAYTDVQVPTMLANACSNFEVRSDIGGSEKSCKDLMKELAQSFKSDRNYYPWCRSLTLSSFDAMKEMEEMFAANKTMVALREECSEHCPFVSKIISAGGKFSQFMEKVMQASPPESDTDMFELLEMSLRQLNQICDWQDKATCSVHNMHESCEKLLVAAIPGEEDPKESLVEIVDECKGRLPCRQACHGVDAVLTDFTLEQFKLSTQAPLPNASLGIQHCAMVDFLLTCAPRPECADYLQGKLSPSYPSAEEYLHTWEPTCKWFGNACAAKRENGCKSEVEAFRKEWVGNFGCMIEKVTEECCNSLEGLAKCDANQGCADHLNEGLPLLELGLEERLPTQCPNLAHTFKSAKEEENVQSNADEAAMGEGQSEGTEKEGKKDEEKMGPKFMQLPVVGKEVPTQGGLDDYLSKRAEEIAQDMEAPAKPRVAALVAQRQEHGTELHGAARFFATHGMVETGRLLGEQLSTAESAEAVRQQERNKRQMDKLGVAATAPKVSAPSRDSTSDMDEDDRATRQRWAAVDALRHRMPHA